MDLHRCRFVPYPPSAINAIAVPFQESLAQRTPINAKARIAIGRANGNVEIWNPAGGAWLQESVMYGGQDRSVDGLVWYSDDRGRPRLFSIGGASAVTEWDVDAGRPKRHASGPHGDIWCVAMQPHGDYTPKLVVGTVDGEVAVYSIEGGSLEFERKFATATTHKKKTNVVSLAFLSTNIVVAGCADGFMRVCDIRRGHAIHKISLGVDAAAAASGSKEIIVWAIKSMPDGKTFITGDSTGHVCVWRTMTYTLVQRIQAHDQDVLSLSVSLDGTSFMSGGMDRRVVMMRKSGQNDRFGEVWGRKYHEHDVKAMASLETSKGISVVITGGPDAAPVIIPLRQHGKEAHRRLSHLPQSVPITSATKARFVVGWWGREIHIWKLRQTFNALVDTEDEIETPEKNHKLLKTIVVKGEASISSVAINSEGTLLVVATATEVKAFRLTHDNPASSADIEIALVPLPERISKRGATLLQLSPTGNTLCIIRDRTDIILLQIHNQPDDEGVLRPVFVAPLTFKMRLPAEAREQSLLKPFARHERGIKAVAFSDDGKMMAATDIAGHIDTWIREALTTLPQQLQNGDDAESESDSESESEPEGAAQSQAGTGGLAGSLASRWIRNPAKELPRLPGSPVAMAFTNAVPDAGPNALLVITANWHFMLLQPSQGTLAPWTKRNPRTRVPDKLSGTLDVPKGVLWQGCRAWFYGVSYAGMIDFSCDLPLPGGGNAQQPHGPKSKQGVKRKRLAGDSGAGNKFARGALAPSKVQKLDSTNGRTWKDVDMEAQPEAAAAAAASGEDDEDDSTNSDSDDSDDSDDEEKNELALVRKERARDGGSDPIRTDKGGDKGKTWWVTYRYRPVLGIVPLSVPAEAEAEAEASAAVEDSGKKTKLPRLEAALVERPLWDADIGVRFLGPEDP